MRLSYDIQWSRQFERINWEISRLTKTALYAPFLTHSKQHSRFRFWHTKTAESWCPMKQNRTLKSNEESLKLHAKTSNNQLHLKILKHVAHFSFEKIKIHVHFKQSQYSSIISNIIRQALRKCSSGGTRQWHETDFLRKCTGSVGSRKNKVKNNKSCQK